MKRSGETFCLVVVAMMAADVRAHAQLMSAGACETPSSRLAETLGIVPDAEIFDGAFVVASATGCSVTPVAPGRSIAGPMAAAIDEARGRAPLPDRDRVIVYVNGVSVTPEIQCETLAAIAAATGATVIGVHNATDGLATDLLQVLVQRELIMQRRSGGPATLLGNSKNGAVNTIRRIVLSSRLSGTTAPEIWAHSQGAVITSLALYEAGDMLKDGDKKSIAGVKVVTFASAAPFFPSGPAYEHYLHTEDAIPRYTGLGRLDWFDEKKAGTNAKVIRFSGRRFLSEGAANAAAPDFAHHDVLITYLPRYLREHGRPASLIQWSRP